MSRSILARGTRGLGRVRLNCVWGRVARLGRGADVISLSVLLVISVLSGMVIIGRARGTWAGVDNGGRSMIVSGRLSIPCPCTCLTIIDFPTREFLGHGVTF